MVASLRLYMAVSLDGFIATPDGGVEWLAPFDDQDFGYAEFYDRVGLLVMGRATYDQTLSFGPWPYDGKPCWVLTGRALDSGTTPDGVGAWTGGDTTALARRARAHRGGDVWIVGGAATVARFLTVGALDQMDLFIMPVCLGRGLPLFPPTPPRLMPSLARVINHPSGVAQLTYRMNPPPHIVPGAPPADAPPQP